ncbi:PREDICTED: endoribonuclease Dicer homolog 2-like isoform X2 [Camelina sativa]|nr:PREDICTED: endoribonuclease Dicer homolog 2-like isoform X2 [Camelina sativa]XP_010485669.1 PREDICTED: endoribonuclease Dicer homolog 2-like isoform X2 [Camelina sativa]
MTMDADVMETETVDQVVSASPLQFARSYQVEALDKAINQNTIVFLETGSGKTLIAIMLLRNYAYLFRKPSPSFSVFLVPQVVLVTQQAEALKMHTDLQVGTYWGDMGVDFWDSSTWKQQVDKYEVLVMTPAILLGALRHSFLNFSMIKVLIVDECHHARGKHPYACIMREFYHKELNSGTSDLPRIFGMTASLVKTKGENLDSYWKKIHELETLMNSKVYTCENEAVLAGFVPFSTPRFKFYQHIEISNNKRASLVEKLKKLTMKHCLSLATLDLKSHTVDSIKKRLSKIESTLTYCLDDLGILLAQKAAQSLSASQNDFFLWGELNMFSLTLVKKFCSDASQAFLADIPHGRDWSVVSNIKGNVEVGLLTSKTVCLVETLLGYSSLENIRCIIFVDRVITAIVLESLLAEILPNCNNWKTKYVAGNNSGLQNQTRKKQNEIVEDFRKGLVNIIVATSILEEGLDVQSCNLVIRFDPVSNICSFIQSRGRARMQNSDYLMMVESGDLLTQSRLKKYISGGKRMREESLHHSLVPCPPLPDDSDELFFRVESTGATVTLSSSVSLIYHYCSRLPSDEYFKPAPRFDINKDLGICTLYLPKSCPVKEVKAQANSKVLKHIVCLEACIQLHEVGALSDHLVPDMVVAETVAQKLEKIHYNTEQPCYFPPELVSQFSAQPQTTYHFYLIRMAPNSPRKFHLNDVLLGTRVELEDDIGNTGFRLEDHKGTIAVTLSYVGAFHLTQEEVLVCRRFQITLFRVLLDQSVENLMEALDGLHLRDGVALDYLLVPSTYSHETSLIDWAVIRSVNLTCHKALEKHLNCSTNGASRLLHTKDGLFCTCVVQNALVYTPHNGYVYCTNGILNNLNAKSLLTKRETGDKTYIEYYEKRHGINLNFVDEPLLNGRHIFTLHNYLHMTKKKKEKEHDREFVELPPELCHIILSPISVDIIYSYTFIPSVMQRIESLLIAYNLKKSIPEVNIPTIKVLEAITTKKCQDQFHLESLETLGDSFLKYAVCQQLFQHCRTHHEGLLSTKKDGMISNVMLCKLGCEQKLQGFIRNECFEPKCWMVPGQSSEAYTLVNDTLPESRNIYVTSRRNLKRKSVADVVESLIGAYLSEGGELAALLFMNWVGIKIDFTTTKIERESLIQAEKLVNVDYMESLLKYKFEDKSLLVEALTHGSYMIPEIPRCYQRLEFLGDSVLDYLITKHLYDKYPCMTPGLLTDMRSASVNNECYAQVAVKANLDKHILHASHDLHKHISRTVSEFERSSLQSTFGWESDVSFPKVLGDVIESLAGAIFVDSGYNKGVVFASIKPLLGCMITPETVKLHPVRELTELCQKAQFELSKAKGFKNGEAYFTVEVKAKEMSFAHTAEASDKKMAKKLAYKQVLNSLTESLPAS